MNAKRKQSKQIHLFKFKTDLTLFYGYIKSVCLLKKERKMANEKLHLSDVQIYV